MSSPSFRPTHRITFTDDTGSRLVVPVQLCEDEPGQGGPAYTMQEWAWDSTADWERHADGTWTCLGQATPGWVVGTVEVVEL